MSETRLVLLRKEGEAPPGWQNTLAELPSTSIEPTASLKVLRSALREVGCVLVDGSVSDATERIRRSYQADPTVQAVLVAPAVEHPRLARALLFTPGIGEVWLRSPEEIDSDLVQRADGLTRTRRSHRLTQSRIAENLSVLDRPREQRAIISDAYLAALLEAVPNPVLSVDELGIVLSWSRGAERVLGYTRSEAVGRRLAEVFVMPDGSPALDGGSGDSAAQVRREIHFQRKNGETGVGELIVSPVEAAGQRVRAVILHDLTTERNAQTEIEAQAVELEAQADELQAQAAELERVNEELQARTVALEQAARTREQFYAGMSHELRTPINAILGFLDLVLTGVYGPLAEKQEEGLVRAQRAARHLHELVNDVLDLARIEAGRMEILVEEVDLPEVIEEVLDTLRALADQTGSELSIHGPVSHRIRTDPRRLRQILLNLLSNAIKFGLGQPIRVRWEITEEEGVWIDVVDKGTGIDPQDLLRIFDEFTQVGSVSQPGTGTGLGLPISLRLAKLLGGSLEASSVPGQGSTFRLVLPSATPEEHR